MAHWKRPKRLTKEAWTSTSHILLMVYVLSMSTLVHVRAL